MLPDNQPGEHLPQLHTSVNSVRVFAHLQLLHDPSIANYTPLLHLIDFGNVKSNSNRVLSDVMPNCK
jgi:hypothetical protein